MDDRYTHPGWTGEPYASDFQAKWGLIRLDEMFDGRSLQTNSEAMQVAKALGADYMLTPKASKAGNRLFKIEGSSPRCVVAMLAYQKVNAAKGNARYRSDVAERLRQLVRVAKTRADERSIPFSLDMAEIVRRGLVGRCEATGLALDLDDPGTKDRKNPMAPSLDQIDPGKGYTMENVQIVCWGYNLMKSNFAPEQFWGFVEALMRSTGHQLSHNSVIG